MPRWNKIGATGIWLRDVGGSFPPTQLQNLSINANLLGNKLLSFNVDAVVESESSVVPQTAPHPIVDMPGDLISYRPGGVGTTEFFGGLFSGQSNQVPLEHIVMQPEIQPLDTSGNPVNGGEIILVSIGMSNTTQEFSVFESDAEANVNLRVAGGDGALRIIDCAQNSMTVSNWSQPITQNPWTTFISRVEAEADLNQVQSAWIKVVNHTPGGAPVTLADNQTKPTSVPVSASTYADAYVLMERLGTVCRRLKEACPNIKQAYFSSRIYAGYAVAGVGSPEPDAYEVGWGIKWLIEAQIKQLNSPDNSPDPIAGDLGLDVAPWLCWSPELYLWADGTTPNNDGLTWVLSDYVTSDQMHPATSGRQKVADRLTDFFENNNLTIWAKASQPTPNIIVDADVHTTSSAIQTQLAGASPGDLIHFIGTFGLSHGFTDGLLRDGVDTILFDMTTAGASGNPIVIDGTNALVEGDFGNLDNLLVRISAQYITLQNFTIKTGAVIVNVGSNFATIQYNEVSDAVPPDGNFGLVRTLGDGTPSAAGPRGVLIYRNYLHDVYGCNSGATNPCSPASTVPWDQANDVEHLAAICVQGYSEVSGIDVTIQENVTKRSPAVLYFKQFDPVGIDVIDNVFGPAVMGFQCRSDDQFFSGNTWIGVDPNDQSNNFCVTTRT